MLVKLLVPAIMNSKVEPLPLPRNCPRPDSTCVLAGWGTSAFQKGRGAKPKPKNGPGFYQGG
uniref:Peptidase S1 domain-containing protein n=1 Tax=Chrysemys picta bellii TaxID=8478 RepID=A0A8C3HA52_CHRPI